jgi:hypothetical protein
LTIKGQSNGIGHAFLLVYAFNVKTLNVRRLENSNFAGQ